MKLSNILKTINEESVSAATVYIAYTGDLFDMVEKTKRLPQNAIVYKTDKQYKEIDKGETINDKNALIMFKAGKVVLFSCEVPEDCLRSISNARDEYRVIKGCEFNNFKVIKRY